MTLIVYYLIFMIAGDFAAYFLGLLIEYGLTREPDRLPGPLFPFSLGVLGARDVGDQTKSGQPECVLVGRRRRKSALASPSARHRLRQNVSTPQLGEVFKFVISRSRICHL